jgi:hypothetical protein
MKLFKISYLLLIFIIISCSNVKVNKYIENRIHYNHDIILTIVPNVFIATELFQYIQKYYNNFLVYANNSVFIINTEECKELLQEYIDFLSFKYKIAIGLNRILHKYEYSIDKELPTYYLNYHAERFEIESLIYKIINNEFIYLKQNILDLKVKTLPTTAHKRLPSLSRRSPKFRYRLLEHPFIS